MNTSQLFTVVGLSLLSVVARGQCTVTTAVDLQQALANTTSGTIQVCGDINLGDLPVDAFPLDLQPNVTLQGDFDLMTNPTGSTIRMPYQFKEDMSCRYGKPISGAKPTGFAFNMGSGSTIRGIHLQGPSNFIKDWRYYRLLGNCSAPETPQVEGLSSGISVRTDGCTVEKCEINGFSYFAVLVDVQDANATFTFAKNFIHHNKMRGYGYGIWVAGRSLSPCTSTADCPGEPIPPSTMANFKTTDVPGLTAFISDCFFWENKHDIAGSGNINSYFVTNCTFSRSTGDVNVDRHTYNWWTCNAVPNPDAPEGSPAREQVITDVGGQNMDFIRCFFYRPGRSVQVPYPNTNACGNNTPGVINFRENFFRGSGVGDIVIAEVVDQNEWSTGHPHIQIGNNVYLNSSPSSPADFAPLIFKPPVAHVASWDVGQPYVPGAPPGLEIGGAQEVQEGGSLGFFTDNCFDSDGSSNSGNLRYMWRFHESSDDMDPGSIIWTDDKPESTPLFHQFNTPGTINVDLIAFDKNTYRVSDIATQRVVVKPNDPNSVHLRFWVSDSYTGRGLLPCPSTPPSAIASKYWNTDQITNPAPTGFVVYAKVDGSEVWSTDIALIDEWRHVDVDITNLIDVSLPLQQHSLEIGLKAVSNVDGAEVRGVEIQLDDVSINGANGWNTLRNPGFEEEVASSFYWARFEECFTCRPSPWPECKGTPLPGFPAVTYVNPVTPTLSSMGSIRSGAYSLMMYVRAMEGWRLKSGNTTTVLNYTPGMYYPPGRYKAVSQSFKYGTTYKSVVSDPSSDLIDYDAELIPNPTDNSGTMIQLSALEGDPTPTYVTVIDATGRVIEQATFVGDTYKLAPIQSNGLYLVRLSRGSGTLVKRLMVKH